jgi:hypothetical protein
MCLPALKLAGIPHHVYAMPAQFSLTLPLKVRKLSLLLVIVPAQHILEILKNGFE